MDFFSGGARTSWANRPFTRPIAQIALSGLRQDSFVAMGINDGTAASLERRSDDKAEARPGNFGSNLPVRALSVCAHSNSLVAPPAKPGCGGGRSLTGPIGTPVSVDYG
jgi:hypothetical protein